MAISLQKSVFKHVSGVVCHVLLLLMCAVRRSQWSGAKALVKLIKPKRENSREKVGDTDKDGVKERERTKSPPDIPLPAPPPLLPPEIPPLPHLTANDKQDGSPAHSNHNHHISTPSLGPLSPALTPINRGKYTCTHTHAHTRACSHTLHQFINQTIMVGLTVLLLCSYRGCCHTKSVTSRGLPLNLFSFFFICQRSSLKRFPLSS